jgi:PAS domain S-box-containing protein
MLSVVIVDDKEQDRYLLQILLEKTGFRVIAASDGAEALTLARQHTPDLIISDVLMPVMDGFTFCREVRRDPNLCRMPFIFYTATYVDPRDEDFALKIGADCFIVKPVEPMILLEKIQQVIADHKSNSLPVNNTDGNDNQYFKRYSEVLVRKLEDKLELFRGIFSIDPSALFVLSSSGIILELNKTAEILLGGSILDILDKNIADQFICSDDRATFLENLTKVNNGITIQEFETRLTIIQNTHPVIMQWNAQRILKSSGIVEGILLIGKDITLFRIAEKQCEEIEAQLRHAQKLDALGQLSGVVAHDFNNLLAAIMGYCNLIMYDKNDLSELDSRLHQIVKCTERAAGLTRQLLAFSRKQELEMKPLNVNTVLKDHEDMLKRLIGETITILFDFDPSIWLVKGDIGQFEQVMMNLVVNARDAMPDGGIVTVTTRNVSMDQNWNDPSQSHVSGDYVKIVVQDTGSGMSDDVKSRLFEPFFTTKESGKGTGLGLATVFGIIKQSGGTIQCESSFGKGTSFIIHLPVATEQYDQDLKRHDAQSENELRGSETILVVEDEESMRDVICRILIVSGYTVLCEQNGTAAYDTFYRKQDRIDMIISDIVLPGLNGLTLVQKIRRMKPEVKVLFVSGYTNTDAVIQGIASNGENFLQKPFNMNILKKKVRMILDRSEMKN